MENNDIAMFFLDCYALLIVFTLIEYYSILYYRGIVNVRDPYFIVFFLYIDYLRDRFRGQHREFLRLVLT